MSGHGFSTRDGLLYGSLGLPLAFVALPLYVLLPNHYARAFGVPLALLGALLLAARLLDAFIDPLLGRWSDRLFAHSIHRVIATGAVAASGLAVGFWGLFFPPVREINGLLMWAAATLVLTYAAYSLLSITHQAWGAKLGGDELQRGRVVAWREGMGLAGVVLAALAPALLGLPATAALFTVCLTLGWLAWTLAPRPAPAEPPPFPVPGSIPNRRHHPDGTTHASSIWHPFTRPSFRRLLGVFVLNGIASAIPATLVLFFVQDRLQAPSVLEPAFLGLYFVSAALSLPLWMRGVRRFGLARTWLAGIVLAVAVFACAATLGAGDTSLFLIVCALSGVALGTDLALPGAMLAGLIAASGDRGQAEGAYFGWWNFAVKLNLALAAGLALPLLSLAGYTPGTRDTQALQALTLAYCALPCALKLLAGGALYALVIRPAPAHRVIPNLQSTS